MAKIMTYSMVILAFSAISQLAGISTVSSSILQYMGLNNPGSVSIAGMYLATLGVFGIVGGAAAVLIGHFANLSPESYLMAGVANGIFLAGIADMVSIWNHAETICPALSTCAWVTPIVQTMMLILMGGYFISIFFFWRGTDN